MSNSILHPSQTGDEGRHNAILINTLWEALGKGDTLNTEVLEKVMHETAAMIKDYHLRGPAETYQNYEILSFQLYKMMTGFLAAVEEIKYFEQTFIKWAVARYGEKAVGETINKCLSVRRQIENGAKYGKGN